MPPRKRGRAAFLAHYSAAHPLLMRLVVMRQAHALALVLSMSMGACSSAHPEEPLAQAETALQIDQGSVGFDEIAWAPGIRRVIVPSGGAGKVHLLDPATRTTEIVSGFGQSNELRGGHTQGPTSAVEADGFVVTVDRTAKRVVVFDPLTREIVAGHDLGAAPDYVRYDRQSREVWVTEPDRERIEIFSLDPARGAAAFERSGEITIADGPESLVFDDTRGRAYANLWHGVTVVIDVATHTVHTAFANGCDGSRVLTLDEPRSLLFTACVEGKVTTMDLAHGGQVVGSITYGEGMDAIAYDARRSLLYVPSAILGTMATIAVGSLGELTLAGEVKTAKGASCVAVDDDGGVWICDPAHGRVLSVRAPIGSEGVRR
jgi:hypothetical protein